MNDKEVIMKIFSAVSDQMENATRKERLRILSVAMQLPLHLMLNLTEFFPEGVQVPARLPDVFIKMLNPWRKLKGKFGNVPLDQFIELLHLAYISQDFPDGLTIVECDYKKNPGN